MAKATGIVEKINVFSDKTQQGRPYTKVSFLVDGEWYGAFRTKANADSLGAVAEQNAVEIEYEQKGQYKNLKDIKVTATNPTPDSAVPAVASAAVSRDQRDYRQALKWAISTASEFVIANKDLFESKLKGDKRAQELRAIVEDLGKEWANLVFTATAPENSEEQEIPTDDTSLSE